MSILKRALFIILTICFCITAASCAKEDEPSNKPVSKTELMLNTVVTITLYSPNAADILPGAFEICKKYENMLSKTISTSDIYKINHSDNEFINVSGETLELIKQSLNYGELSGGAFDITIGAVSDLWDFGSRKENIALPPSSKIVQALETVDYEQIEFDGSRVRLTKQGAQIDLGAIAKGFIADRIADYLYSQNVQGAIIDLGGNILAVGEKPTDEPWIVGIQKPFSEGDKMIATLSLPNKSVVSSGIYERYFELDGKIYHHILDTSTGYPMAADMISVTIVSDKSVDGDALSTAAFCMGIEKGLALIESLDNTEAAFVSNDNKIYCTSGFNKDIPIELLDNSYTVCIVK